MDGEQVFTKKHYIEWVVSLLPKTAGAGLRETVRIAATEQLDAVLDENLNHFCEMNNICPRCTEGPFEDCEGPHYD